MIEEILEKGWWLYGEDRVLTQQCLNVKDFFKDLIQETSPSIIIEIGTSFGGFTCILSDIIKELSIETKLISVDNSIRPEMPYLSHKYNFQSLNINIGTPDDNKIIEYIVQNNQGKTMILCDGGGKSYEFNTFSNYLKAGDIIGAHDYADNLEFFNSEIKGKIWNWMEIENEHIKNAVEKNNLKDLDNNFTLKGKYVAWILKIKK